MKKKLHKIYLTYYSLVIAHDLWQAHYKIYSVIVPKELIKLNVNMDMMIKDVKLGELYINIATVSLSTEIL